MIAPPMAVFLIIARLGYPVSGKCREVGTTVSQLCSHPVINSSYPLWRTTLALSLQRTEYLPAPQVLVRR
jgi:hypothetical protein